MAKRQDNEGEGLSQEKQGGLISKGIKAGVKLLVFKEKTPVDNFILEGVDERKQEERREEEDVAAVHTAKDDKTGEKARANKGKLRQKKSKKCKKPMRVKRLSEQKGPITLDNLLVSPELKVNKEYLETIFSLPENKDFVLRDFKIFSDKPTAAFALFMEGMADRSTINEGVLKPLMLLDGGQDSSNDVTGIKMAEYIKERVVYGNQVDIIEKYEDIVEKVNYGGTAVFIDGCPRCILVETKGWDRRPIGKSETEQIIWGPHEAFNETLRSNTGLIRKSIRNTNLMTELIKVGVQNRTDAAVMYMKNIANPRLVEEVKRRIEAVKSDYVGESGMLEQFIEDHPFMPVPQILATERPDRVVTYILEGKVAILIDGNPHVLIVPTTFFSLLQTSEDYYLRLPYGNILRVLRVGAMFIATTLPAVYVAITTFHQEMIPTDLILAIAAARETVPLPTVVEVFMMEFAFELIREAGLRVPGVIGNTLGIVGALILGQAAVQAGIVSPILIIIVAVTGLASFTIPNYSMAFALRGIRFAFTALAAVFGFLGVSAAFFVILTSLASMKSFGVPLLVPKGPKTKTESDVVLRGPVWSMEERPDYLDTLNRRRQPRISRKWTVESGKRGDDN